MKKGGRIKFRKLIFFNKSRPLAGPEYSFSYLVYYNFRKCSYFSPSPRGLIRVYRFGTVFVVLKMMMVMITKKKAIEVEESAFRLSKSASCAANSSNLS